MSRLHAITPVQSIREVVYEQLKNAVLSGGFANGERLVESDLATRMQVSRTPVREALRRLEAEGLLEALPKNGLVVKNYSGEEIREVYMIREALESLAAEYAAKNATPKEIEQLDRLVDEMEHADKYFDQNPHRAMEIHRKFSEVYNRASHMPMLVDLIESLKEQVSRFRHVSLSGSARRELAKREHRALLEALKQRDPERASALTKTHIQNALVAYFQNKDNAGGDAEHGENP